MVFRNGSEEDYNVSTTGINDTLRKSNLTEEPINLKDVIRDLATKGFGPVIREMIIDNTTKENIAGNETNCHVFHFRNNPLTVTVTPKLLKHHKENDDLEQEQDHEERRLSGKFSGLEKMKNLRNIQSVTLYNFIIFAN